MVSPFAQNIVKNLANLSVKMLKANNANINCVYISWFTIPGKSWVGNCTHRRKLGGCPFNGPLSVMKYPTRESPRRDAASPIKYNGLRVPQPSH